MVEKQVINMQAEVEEVARIMPVWWLRVEDTSKIYVNIHADRHSSRDMCFYLDHVNPVS